MLETQVAQWGYNIALELGAEEMGFDIMVTSGEANRTLISKALNRRINEGDIVHIGVAPKRDGLTACQRASVVAVDIPGKISTWQKYWFDFVEDAYRIGLDTLNSNEPLGNQIVTMLDVAIRGVGNGWNDIIIPNLDYIVVEKTLGKYGNKVKVMNQLPINLQHLAGKQK